MIDADTAEKIRRIPATITIREIMGIKNIETRNSIARPRHDTAECIV